MIDLNNISTIEDLKSEKLWVTWKYEDKKNGKGTVIGKTKIPYSTSGRRAESNNPDTWDTFKNVDIMREKYPENIDGIGFMIPAGVVVIDIDNHGDGEDNPLQKEINNIFCGTYMEISPSGKGNHIIFKINTERLFPCGIDKSSIEDFKLKYYMKHSKIDVEEYIGGATNRYMTFTEESVSGVHDIEDKTEEFIYFLNKYMRKADSVEAAAINNTQEHRSSLSTSVGEVLRGYDPEGNKSVDDFLKGMKELKESGKAKTEEELLEIAFEKNPKFKDLYETGNYENYSEFVNPNTGSHDHSAADLWLCKSLAFFLYPCYGVESIDKYFRKSKLYREKWERKDYRQSTINEALKHIINGVKANKKDENGNILKSYFFGMNTRIVNEDGTTRENHVTLNGKPQKNTQVPQIDVESLTAETILEERVFVALCGESDKITQVRLRQKLEAKAAALGMKKQFSELLKLYDEQLNKKGKKSSAYEPKKPFTIEVLEEELEKRNISLKYNSISNELEVYWNIKEIGEEDKEDTLPTMLRSQLCDTYKYCNKDNVYDYLSYIAKRNRYNPVLEVINANKWDGEDRLPKLFEILNIEKDDNLSKTLIIKWIWQGLALLENDKKKQIAPQGVLTLAGGQGIGKTTFFNEIARLSDNCHYFRGGQSIDSFDKDLKKRCVTTWICELGEVDTTLKSDMGMLKAFLTSSYDEYRLPYARTDTQAPRRTNMCATVNGTEFLIDPTGNRRFWTVPVDKIDIEGIKKFNSLQLWEQIKEQYYSMNHTGFFLNTEEQEELEERNKQCEKPIKAEAEIRDIIFRLESNPDHVTEEMTVSEFRAQHIGELSRFDVRTIGLALTKLGYPAGKSKKISGKTQRLRELPKVEAVPFPVIEGQRKTRQNR